MLWRLHIKTSNDDANDYCIKENIAGVGWSVDCNPKNIEEYKKACQKIFENGDAGYKSPTSYAFIEKPKIGDLIWTRDKSNNYYIGKIDVDGEWHYDCTELAKNLDIPNQRKCKWKKIGNESEIPGKIVNSFIMGRTFQKINSFVMEEISNYMYSGNTNKKIDKLKESFFDLISHTDCEDIVGIYLQKKHNYFFIPSTCKNDTKAYEFVLYNDKGEDAVVQVKQGEINLNDSLSDSAKKVFLFTTKGKYEGNASNVTVLTKEELFSFCINNKNILPKKIIRWIDFMGFNNEL